MEFFSGSQQDITSSQYSEVSVKSPVGNVEENCLEHVLSYNYLYGARVSKETRAE